VQAGVFAMVDIVSDAGSGRTIRRVSASFRLRSPSSSRVEKVRRPDAITPDAEHDEAMVRVCLEIQEDKTTGAIVYRLINVLSGVVIQEWRSEDVAELRDFLQENRIQLLDKRV
jgi:hypothetical protein